ncbi:MAG: hypothetical protein QMD71_09295 [bacterium]|nr:hypothetical protein [bacterium]
MVKVSSNLLSLHSKIDQYISPIDSVGEESACIYIHNIESGSDIFRFDSSDGSELSETTKESFLTHGVAYFRGAFDSIDIFVAEDTLVPDSFLNLTIKRIVPKVCTPALLGHSFGVLHASGIGIEGKCVLFVGDPGAGKTTVILNLVNSGFQFICDDKAFLKKRDSRINIFSVSGTVSVKGDTNLIKGVKTAQYIWGGKCSTLFNVGDAFSDSKELPARLIFFISGKGNSLTYKRISATESLKKLFLPGVAHYLKNNKESAAEKFNFLVDLVSQTRQYELFLGKDMHRLPDVIKNLLEEL